MTRPRVNPIDWTLTNQNETRRPQWFLRRSEGQPRSYAETAQTTHEVGRKDRRAVAMTQMTFPTVTMSTAGRVDQWTARRSGDRCGNRFGRCETYCECLRSGRRQYQQ